MLLRPLRSAAAGTTMWPLVHSNAMSFPFAEMLLTCSRLVAKSMTRGVRGALRESAIVAVPDSIGLPLRRAGI